jgi:3'-5' exoribonuclease
MKQRLINHIQSIASVTLRKTCESILTYEKFFVWPASLSHHHAYEGGLLAHTVEVCDIAIGIARAATTREVFQGCPTVRNNFEMDSASRDIILAAALWHDLMKVEEYEEKFGEDRDLPKYHLKVSTSNEGMHRYFTNTQYQKKIGHISGSTLDFQRLAYYNNVGTDVIHEVTHCLLAHHGRKEWGSPVEPQTVEALILHQADMLSAQYGATKEVAP